MKFLSVRDPSASHFEVKVGISGKQRFLIKKSAKADNTLQIIDGANSNEWGLYVPPIPRDIAKYPLTWSRNARGQDSGENRRMLQVSSVGMGIIHLDMQITARGTIATLPNNAPTPVSLIEMQLGDGSIYIDAGSRNITATGNIQLNKRYIVDMVGFFA